VYRLVPSQDTVIDSSLPDSFALNDVTDVSRSTDISRGSRPCLEEFVGRQF